VARLMCKIAVEFAGVPITLVIVLPYSICAIRENHDAAKQA
jgi:hypothetical protein